MITAEIKVGQRHRKDLGDIAGLAKSIQDVGLLQPLVVALDGTLIAGRRRLAAVHELGWEEVPVLIRHDLADALPLLLAERDENTCRKDFTPIEAVAIGAEIERLEKALAAQSKKASQAEKGQKVGAKKRGKADQGGGNLPPPSGSKGKTRDKVAAAVGMSGKTYEKAKAVVEAAEKGPAHAKAAREMDATGNVDRAFKKVKGLPPETKRKVLELFVRNMEFAAIAAQPGLTLGQVTDVCRMAERNRDLVSAEVLRELRASAPAPAPVPAPAPAPPEPLTPLAALEKVGDTTAREIILRVTDIIQEAGKKKPLLDSIRLWAAQIEDIVRGRPPRTGKGGGR